MKKPKKSTRKENRICVGQIYYRIDESTLTARVVMSPNGEYFDMEEVDIPASISYQGDQYQVTSIGMGAFSGCNKLMKVALPSSVKKIGIRAFAGCSDLKRVSGTISDKVIGMSAFVGCDSL